MDILNAQVQKNIRIKFVEDVLGTCSANPELHDEFIASKAPDAKTREDEVAALGVGDVIEKEMTIFPRLDDGTPFFWGYQVEGFIEAAIKTVKNHWPKSECAKIKANKQTVDTAIFVYAYNPQGDKIKSTKIRAQLPKGGVVGDCQRSLRADTAQGARTALAHSESLPAGTELELTICIAPVLYKGVDADETLKEILDYGLLNGIGQWRNSGKGRFVWEEIDA